MAEPLSHVLHPRGARGGRYVYAARSRRSGGVSVGINLDPQRTCNFDCVYCEVTGRTGIPGNAGRPPIDPAEVARELGDELLRWPPPAPGVDTVCDVAFAGDGEPSTFPGFFRLAGLVLDVRDARGFATVPVVLITNGSGLGRPEMVSAHDLFAARGGIFWVKLDAGTEAGYREICRTEVPFDRVLANLRSAALRHPVVVQSMFLSWRGAAPSKGEVTTWAGRLRAVVAAGGRISLVQVYTVARATAELGAEPLPAEALEAIADAARAALPTVPVTVFP